MGCVGRKRKLQSSTCSLGSADVLACCECRLCLAGAVPCLLPAYMLPDMGSIIDMEGLQMYHTKLGIVQRMHQRVTGLVEVSLTERGQISPSGDLKCGDVRRGTTRVTFPLVWCGGCRRPHAHNASCVGASCCACNWSSQAKMSRR